MVRCKAASKKQQSRGVDFKKIKRKVGRKLPPPSNVTNTEIKSKAIILPEQSVASEKVGLAVSKKGLTLKELLQQTSHHNVKVRKDALLGIRELLLKHPTELKLHKLAIIEKLRERISDDDKVVRETLYQLFKSVILPGCKEDNQGALISLVMAYIFNAMTHLSIDVRLMAFKFFDLVVQNYPPAFFSYAEKVLENYMDLLKKSQFHMEDKSKLKIALSGLSHCLSLLPSNEKEVDSFQQDKIEKELLFAFDPDVPRDSTGHVQLVAKLQDLVPLLVNCFDGLKSAVHSQPILDSQSFDCMLSVLQCIDLVVQYCLFEIAKCQRDVHTSKSLLTSIGMYIHDEKFPPLFLGKLFAFFPMQPMHHLSEKDNHRYFSLNAVIARIFLSFDQWIGQPPVLRDGVLKFLVDALFKIYGGEFPDNAFYEKHLLPLVPFIPRLVSSVDWSWKHPLLQAFTLAFSHSYPDSAMKMACLKAVEEMLVSKQHIIHPEGGDEEALHYQKAWMSGIVLLLNSIGNRHPSYSHAALLLQLRLGQIGLSNRYLAEEYDKMQDDLQRFYCIFTEDGDECYGPFMELPLDSQEISICCLYYFTSLNRQLLASLALCCLSHSLEPYILFRLIEVLHSSYKAGRIQIAEYISFFITLLSQSEVTPEERHSGTEKDLKMSGRGTFREVTGVICSFLTQMGDQSQALYILEEAVVDLIACKLPLENTCALMRMLITVDCTPTRLLEKSVKILVDVLPSYLVDVALLFPEDNEAGSASSSVCTWRYYLLPCLLLFDRNMPVLKHLICKMDSMIAESCELLILRDNPAKQDHLRRIQAATRVFSMLSMDARMRTVLSLYKGEIDSISQRLHEIQCVMVSNLSIEQQHMFNLSIEKLKNVISDLSNMTS
uniref:Uncharacterized protein n=1 Tax=Opuntia streptacantha TaxID=393608 RepID=A0A7C9EBQ9_OPUST